ncbi:MAG: hypothetical protein JWN86_1905 [Planctomycetota bacterium]|nr:hypothetical protein [Planctomycetota bacterium]
MILESLVTTLNEDGSPNIAPMGPRVEPGMGRFVLRPFKTATTYRNLKRLGEGVLHVTDDVLMLARAAIGEDPRAETRAAGAVRGRVILEACRYYEFRVIAIDDREDRTTIAAETVASGVLREFFGLNRAKHAVVEGAILATRVGILPGDEIVESFDRLVAPVEKTGGPDEIAAFALLAGYLRDRGLPVPDFPRP